MSNGNADPALAIAIEPLTAAAFAPFGEVLEAAGTPTKWINQGRCGRFHDLARLDFGPEGRAGISYFSSAPSTLPLTLDLMERHPLGSQAFLPLSSDPFLVIVAGDDGGKPGRPRAFLTIPFQGVNYHPNIWHGVLTPLDRPALFAVIDRIGPGANLEEYYFKKPFCVG